MIKWHGSPDLHSCLRASVQAPRELLELLLQPLQAPRELLLQPFILCSAELFPNQRRISATRFCGSWSSSSVIGINSPNSVASL
jgi:hypothetical protein